jgi:predicted phosphodiesterase
MSWQDEAVQLRDEGKTWPAIADLLSLKYHTRFSIEAVRSACRRRKDKAHLTEESAVLHLADLHCGRHTSSFDLATLKRRLHCVVDHALAIWEILRHGYKLRELVIADTGDNVDGDEIYKAHAYHTDESAKYAAEQLTALLDIIAPEIRRLKAIAPTIRFIGVPGNHGRVSRYTHEANNWDLVFYEMLKREFAGDPSITVEYTKDFAQVVDVEGHGVLLYHGGGIRMYQNMPFYGIRQRVMRWKGSMKQAFEVVLMGHFHQVLQDSFNGTRVLLSGTMVSDDEWAVENLGMDGERRFQFFGVHKERPVTWRYELETE